MLVSVELDLDLDDVESILDTTQLLSDGELSEIAWRAVAMIDARTSRGRDAYGNAFAPYSEAYLKKLKKKRRSRKVNLLDTGAMMGAMQGGSEGNAAFVFFANQSAAQIADFHTSDSPRSVQKQRNFLDLDEDGREAETLAEMAAVFIARRFA